MFELSVDDSKMSMTWEEVVCSEEWEYMGEYLVSQSMNQSYAASVDDDNPWFFEDLPFGGPLIHPAVLHIIAFAAANQKSGVLPRPDRPSVHAKQRSEFLNPVCIGKKIRIEGRVPEKYSKTGKDYLIQEVRLTDEDGVPLLVYKHTRVFPRRG